MLTILLLMMMDDVDQAGVKILRKYQNPLNVSEDYLAYPYSVDFDAEGNLFVADRNQVRIMIWDRDGNYVKGFGKRGEGPGEIAEPLELSVVDDEVWVWDSRQSISIFDTNGNFKEKLRTTGHFPRKMTAINKDTAILGVRTVDDVGNMGMRFARFDRKSGDITTLQEWDNESFVTHISGEDGNTLTLNAFAHEIDIQRDERGQVHFGFSQYKTIYSFDKMGQAADEWRFKLPDVKPTAEDRELVYAMSFPTPNGQRLSLKNFPGIKMQFDVAKTPYTHFLIKSDKVLFVRTPIGSIQGVGSGYSQATYYICDRKTGEPLKTGHYQYPEDSMVFFRNGRIIACIVTGEDEYELAELTIEGF